MISTTVPKDEQKLQGYAPLYNVWALQRLVDAGHVGVNMSDAVSNIVLEWFKDNKKLVRECRLTTADFEAKKKKSGPQGIVPPADPSLDSDEPVDRSAYRVVPSFPSRKASGTSGRGETPPHFRRSR